MAFPFYQLIFGSLAVIVSLYTQKYKELDRNKWLDEIDNVAGALPKVQEFDFIIVGGGSAGGVLTNRLSAKYNVLLLEAGGDPIPQTDVPAYWPMLYPLEDVAYQWTTTKQKKSCLANDGKIVIAQGKSLGGSSSVNAMNYNRGSPYDYDNWAQITGDSSWSYENILKYFKMSENFLWEHHDHLGNSGPMSISRGIDILNKEERYWLEQWKKAGEEIGYKSHDYSNTPQKEGFTSVTETKKFGRRVSTWNSFIQPVQNRQTLTIHRYSVVEKVHFDGKGQAVGVFYKRHGVNQYAKARKEIILSAGALNSPHILMNSGIGPKDQLQKAKIPVKVDLPVGQFFQDHPGIFLNMVISNKETYPNPDEDEINEFIESGKGPLANVLQIFAQAFLVSSETKKETDKEWPDIQFITGLNASGLVNGENQWLNFVILGRPKSVGKVTLNKQDPMKPLDVDPNYFDTDHDIKVIVEGVKIAQKVAETKAVRDVGVTLDKKPVPECKQHTFGTDDYWTCWARQLTSTVWHPVGTCRMGKTNDPKAVVDPTLKVKGVKGLRVIDNSVQPAITNANTNSPAILIGQKGADMILTEWMAKDDARNLNSNSNAKHTEL